jgi:hypothetical protein
MFSQGRFSLELCTPIKEYGIFAPTFSRLLGGFVRYEFELLFPWATLTANELNSSKAALALSLQIAPAGVMSAFAAAIGGIADMAFCGAHVRL